MFGGGSRYSQLRMIRLALLAAVLLAGVALHRSGGAYVVIRSLYLVVIVGFVVFSWTHRRGAGGRQGSRWPGGTGRGGGWGRGAGGSPPAPLDVRPIAPDQPAAIAAPGWFPDPLSTGVERYWDGLSWVKSRHREGESWVED